MDLMKESTVSWIKPTLYVGMGVLGSWQLVRYMQRVREFSQISCDEPSLLEMGSVFFKTGGDIGKVLLETARKHGHRPLKLRFCGGHVNLMIASSPGMYELSPLPKGKWYAMLHVLFGRNSLITLNHDGHKRHRRLLSHGFSMGQLQGFIPAFERHATNLVKAWKGQKTIDLHDWMTRVTFDIISDQAFGYDAKCIEGSVEGNDFARSCCKIAKMVMHHWLHVPGLAQLWRLINYQTFSCVDRIIYQCIADRKAERAKQGDSEPQGSKQLSPRSATKGNLMSSAKDLLDLMLNQGEFTDLELRDEAFIFFLAGHETTAITMTWLFLHLANDEALQQRLREEVLAFFAKDTEKKMAVSEKEKCLPLMKQCINETLRLYPPAFAFTRHAEQEVEMDGARVPAGFDVFISLLGMHRDGTVFENPDEFDVTRWDTNPEGKGKDGRVYFNPFSFGQRQCIGLNLARLEMLTIVCEVLRAYQLRLIGGIPGWTTLPITTSPDRHVSIELTAL